MAEPVKIARSRDAEPADDPSDTSTLLRWVERPNGQLELRQTPLTPEDFLFPQIGDTWVQGKRHNDTRDELYWMLEDHFRDQRDVLVLSDMEHLFGAGLPHPAPDLSVLRGVNERELDRESFDIVAEGIVPCLILEIVSPRNSRIRRVDLDDKVELYERFGISEYLIADSPRATPGRRYTLLGYRLDARGRYRPIEPDAQGRIFSKAAGLWFAVSPDRNRIFLFESPGGRRLLSADEMAAEARWEIEARRAAEERAKAAEADNARLRAELERLRGRG